MLAGTAFAEDAESLGFGLMRVRGGCEIGPLATWKDRIEEAMSQQEERCIHITSGKTRLYESVRFVKQGCSCRLDFGGEYKTRKRPAVMFTSVACLNLLS